MNLSVTYTHFFLEGAYADVIRTSICILLGVNPALFFFIVLGGRHLGAPLSLWENIMKDGRMGFLSRIILTPSASPGCIMRKIIVLILISATC